MTLAKWLLIPVFIQVGLVFYLIQALSLSRIKVIRQKQIPVSETALGYAHWPEHVQKLGNNFRNQFEMPILFYTIVPLLLVFNLVDLLQVVFAWGFAVSRVLHCVIHTGKNIVPLRGLVFATGVFSLVAMWVWFALKLYVIG